MLFSKEGVKALNPDLVISPDVAIWEVPQLDGQDYDGNIGDTNAAMGRFEYTVRAGGFAVPMDAINQARAESKRSKGSFQPLTEVERHIGSDGLAEFRQHYRANPEIRETVRNGVIVSEEVPLMHPDGYDLLEEYRNSPASPWFIHTYTEQHLPDPNDGGWQQDKLMGGGFEGFACISGIKSKGRFALRIYDLRTGLYEAAGLAANGTVTDVFVASKYRLADDKRLSFDPWDPETMEGMLTARSDGEWEAGNQPDARPANVGVQRQFNPSEYVDRRFRPVNDAAHEQGAPAQSIGFFPTKLLVAYQDVSFLEATTGSKALQTASAA